MKTSHRLFGYHIDAHQRKSGHVTLMVPGSRHDERLQLYLNGTWQAGTGTHMRKGLTFKHAMQHGAAILAERVASDPDGGYLERAPYCDGCGLTSDDPDAFEDGLCHACMAELRTDFEREEEAREMALRPEHV